jgi:hypothetical protein
MWKISQHGSMKSIDNDSMTTGRQLLSNQIEPNNSWAHMTLSLRGTGVHRRAEYIPLEKQISKKDDVVNYHN